MCVVSDACIVYYFFLLPSCLLLFVKYEINHFSEVFHFCDSVPSLPQTSRIHESGEDIDFVSSNSNIHAIPVEPDSNTLYI